MNIVKNRLGGWILAGLLILLTPGTSTGQDSTNKIPVIPGEQYEYTGVVQSVAESSDSFILREGRNREIEVLLVDQTRIKEKKKNPFRGPRLYSDSHLLQGLIVKVKGRADSDRRLVAKEIRFTQDQYEIARFVQSRVQPVEDELEETQLRLSQNEENARRLSDQVVEVNSIANSARGEAKTAQDTADTALSGLSAANHRISELDLRTSNRFMALDEVEELRALTIHFKAGSSKLSERAKEQLDDFAFEAKMEKGYLIEVTGYASSDGDAAINKLLSQKRAGAVVDYLIEVPGVPLRRVVTPFGYGEKMPVADNGSREGRNQNRRVELKILINRGLVDSTALSATNDGN